MISSRGRLRQFFSSRHRFALVAFVLCSLVIFSTLSLHGESKRSGCRLTITVTVAPTVQNSVVPGNNSVLARPAIAADVTFTMAPDSSQLSSQIDVHEVSIANQSVGQSTAPLAPAQPSILQTLTVVPR